MAKRRVAFKARQLDETAPQYVLRLLADGPIPQSRASNLEVLASLRAMRRAGTVEHEYDERGELVWRLK